MEPRKKINNESEIMKLIMLRNVTDHIFHGIKVPTDITNNVINILAIGGGKGYGKIMYNRNDVNYYCLDLNSSRFEENPRIFLGRPSRWQNEPFPRHHGIPASL